MEFLRELNNNYGQNQQIQNLQVDYEELKHQYYNILDQVSILSEKVDFSKVSAMDVESQLDQLHRMFLAARKGLGLVNKMRPGPDRGKNASRVLTNLNQIRATLGKVMKSLQTQSVDAPDVGAVA